MRLLVIGATGGTGREIVAQAKAAGHEVTAFVRNEADGRDALPGTTLVTGDARDTAALRRAVAGHDAVADALGSGLSGPFGEVTLFSESTKALIEAMRAEGVRRLVCITGIGAGDSRGHGGFVYDRLIQPLLLRGVYADKDRQEELIRASGLDWVIVRPGILTDGPKVGGTKAITDFDGVHGGKISRADTAAFVVAQITGDEWLHKAPLIIHGETHGAHPDAGDGAVPNTEWRAPAPSPYDIHGHLRTARDVLMRQPGEGHRWQWLEGEVTFLNLGHEVDDAYTVLVGSTPKGGGPVPHVQTREDEFFYVLDGGPVEFTAGDRTVNLTEGDFITIRSGTAHYFKVTGEPARMLCFNAPAGFDRFQFEGAAPWNEPGGTRPPKPEVVMRLGAFASTFGMAIPPDPAFFERAPNIQVLHGGATPVVVAGVGVEVLAEARHTGGRYALVRATVPPGGRIADLGSMAGTTGLYVLSGQVAAEAQSNAATLGRDGFMHLAAGVTGSLANDGQTAAAVLIWRAPGVDVPLIRA